MRYTNDCKNCIYLGQHKEFDLYVCDQTGLTLRTYIARYGDGANYSSMPLLVLEQLLPGEIKKLGEAAKAIMVGYMIHEEKYEIRTKERHEDRIPHVRFTDWNHPRSDH